jgi:hypothetical protein
LNPTPTVGGFNCRLLQGLGLFRQIQSLYSIKQLLLIAKGQEDKSVLAAFLETKRKQKIKRPNGPVLPSAISRVYAEHDKTAT